MTRLFRWLVFGDGHLHRWKIIRQGNKTLYSSSGKGYPDGYYYDLQCGVCGNVKVKNT